MRRSRGGIRTPALSNGGAWTCVYALASSNRRTGPSCVEVLQRFRRQQADAQMSSDEAGVLVDVLRHCCIVSRRSPA